MHTPGKKITQFSTVNALLVSLFDGVFSVDEIGRAGSFGIGCSHAMDGEALFYEGDCFVARAHRPLERLAGTAKLPFAQVTDFAPEATFAGDELTKAAFSDALVAHAGSRNLFVAVRLEGRFRSVKVRRPPAVHKPYPPMVDILAHQEEEVLTDVDGVMVGFWAPQAYQGITVAGLHVHFMVPDRTKGGHVLEFTTDTTTVSYETYAGIDIRLPETDAFLAADLSYADLDDHIRKVEG